MNIIHKETQFTSNWSGGTTTKLFIYPPEARYSERNFQFRISTATVETETSTFTALPGYNRILMILKGELEITHQGLYNKKLQPFEQDSFDGGRQTSAIGMVTDFNIMYTEGWKANLKVINTHTQTPLEIATTDSFIFGYIVEGTLSLHHNTSPVQLNPSDFIAFDKHKTYTLSSPGNCTLLLMELTEEFEM